MGYGALYNLPKVWQVAQVRLNGRGFAVMLGTTYEGMAMALAMTLRAQCDAIGHVVSQFWVFCEWLDVMWMELYRFATAFVVVSATILASVVIALEDSFSPFANGIVLFLTAFSTVHLTHNEHSTTVARSWQVGGA